MPAGPLFDYLIRPQQERLWDRQAEGLGGLEVDDQLELGGLLDGQVAYLGTLEDPVDVGRRAPEEIGHIGPVGHEAARPRVFCEAEHRGQLTLVRELDD